MFSMSLTVLQKTLLVLPQENQLVLQLKITLYGIRHNCFTMFKIQTKHYRIDISICYNKWFQLSFVCTWLVIFMCCLFQKSPGCQGLHIMTLNLDPCTDISMGNVDLKYLTCEIFIIDSIRPTCRGLHHVVHVPVTILVSMVDTRWHCLQ